MISRKQSYHGNTLGALAAGGNVWRRTFFEKILIVFVSAMGLSFLLSLFFVQPLSMDIVKGLVPTIPKVAGGKMLVAAFVGTTMAAATFLSRPLSSEFEKYVTNTAYYLFSMR